jgi:hypothetical protein
LEHSEKTLLVIAFVITLLVGAVTPMTLADVLPTRNQVQSVRIYRVPDAAETPVRVTPRTVQWLYVDEATVRSGDTLTWAGLFDSFDSVRLKGSCQQAAVDARWILVLQGDQEKTLATIGLNESSCMQIDRKVYFWNGSLIRFLRRAFSFMN